MFDSDSSSSSDEERRDPKPKPTGPTGYGQKGHPFHNALVPAGQHKEGRSGLKGFKQFLKEHGGDEFEKIKDKMEDKFDDIGDDLEAHARKFGDALDKVKVAAVEKLGEILGPIIKVCFVVLNRERTS